MKKKTIGIIIVSVLGRGSDLLQCHVYASVSGCQEQQGGI